MRLTPSIKPRVAPLTIRSIPIILFIGDGSGALRTESGLWVKPVGPLGFQEAAEALDWIEFRTVGRQTQVGWHARVRWSQLEAGLVGDDPIKGRRFEA